ncbi:hypothetical protein J2W42_001213 [Rhizobium tibeticum]|uniref:Uncharacterized protein n=1 Tax=Rhizobium tibeticum TaxID=501024 RepID=A0A1H8CID3_9HYPH|nr:hypothetical protein [Rhizobium tibeticum]MDP9808375.1 hypothetical protein [Rhizobium tibeticum]SEH47760.1 hypothetical protein RTCCBAU85039_0615 [Rhizobium tibeticum]SEM94760.1 hypothetical protein SAMN05216228_1001167 [Rhizobium tibeticum]
MCRDVLAGEFVLMVAVAIYAHQRIAPDSGSIPMQWSLTGIVNWSAPRLLAFAFIPILALAAMLLLASGGTIDPSALGLADGIFLACRSYTSCRLTGGQKQSGADRPRSKLY